MEYVTGWRMALAKDLLVRQEAPLVEIATRIGYASASAFSVAFTRHVGVTPGVFARTD
jgi:AraC-like DNA-binding protein